MNRANGDCKGPCHGRGWVLNENGSDWVHCKECFGSGYQGTRAPNEVLTSSGKISRGRHFMYPPAKPKPSWIPSIKKGGKQ